jgi:NAD dependent epimerase/dehydratase family enzyme
MGEASLLSGQRVASVMLQSSGYKFKHIEIGEALQSMVG